MDHDELVNGGTAGVSCAGHVMKPVDYVVEFVVIGDVAAPGRSGSAAPHVDHGRRLGQGQIVERGTAAGKDCT